MEKTGLSKYANSFGIALALASVVNALLVVIKEKSPAVQTSMKNLTGHHWITQSGFIVGLFLLAGWLFAQVNAGQGFKLTTGRVIGAVVAGVGLGATIIFAFYLIGD